MRPVLTSEQQKRVDALAKMSPAEWDSICKRCGICCLEKAKYDLGILSKDIKTVYLKRCCDKLDTKTCQCTVYQSRLKSENCKKVDIDVVLEGVLVPASCGYVEYIFGPAPFPAKVDFSQVKPVPDNEYLSEEQMEQNIIHESILWNERSR